MGLQLVYWLCLGGGVGLLGASVLFDAFDFLDVDLAGSDVDIAPVLFAGTAAFGAGGLVGIHGLGLGAAGSFVTGAIAGAVFAVLTAALFVLLHALESRGSFSLDQLVGRSGHCSLALGPGLVGRVSVQYEGMTRTLTATSRETVAPGDEVVVSDVSGDRLVVVRRDSLGLPE